MNTTITLTENENYVLYEFMNLYFDLLDENYKSVIIKIMEKLS